MRQYRFVLALAVLTIAGCCLRAPWVQGAGGDGSDNALGFAPVWTSNFRLFPGARIDRLNFSLEVVLSLSVVALIGAGQALRRRNP
jgi:hypothetical protein